MIENLPELFSERLQKIIGAEKFEQIKPYFTKRPLPSFRLHHKDAKHAQVKWDLETQGFKLEPIQWYSDAFRLLNKNTRELQETHSYQNHYIYIQNLSSMLPPLALNPQKGDEILDVCAAPGSKTGQLLKMLNGAGKLTANEKIKNRFFKLKNNLDLQGYDNFKLTLKPGELYCKIAPNRFDRILLDSPCSSEGRFLTTNKDTYKYWSPSKIKEMVFKQHALFKSSFLSLKPGGIMVYATCTFAPEENEGILNWALKKTDDKLEILPWDSPTENWMEGITEWDGKIYSEEVKKARRILPNKEMSAFFIALVRKKA